MKNITIISVPVTNQERAKEFYLKFGFKLIEEAPFGPDQKWIQLGLPGTETTITLVNWFKEMPAGCLRGFVIASEDLNNEIKELNSKGIETGKIDDTPWGKFVSVKDPDGNVWSLHQK